MEAKSDNTAFGSVIVRVASANPAVLDEHNSTTILRLRALLTAAVDDVISSVAVTQLRHPVYLLGSMLETLGEKRILEVFKDLAPKIVRKYSYTGTMVQKLDKAPGLRKMWVGKLKEEAGSNIFDTANRFASNIPEIDDLLPALITPREAFDLVVRVCNAADRGAFTSRDLRAGRFSAVPKLRELAVEYAEEHPRNAHKLVEAVIADDLKSFLEKYLTDE